MKRLFRAIFGCPHKNITFPQTPRKGVRVPAAKLTGYYVVCLDCGSELPYDWETMRLLTPSAARAKANELKLERSAL